MNYLSCQRTDEELFNYCLKEYNSSNIFTKYLINNYFKNLFKIINCFDTNYKFLEVGCGAGESSRRIYSFLNGQSFEASEYDERYVRELKKLNLPFNVKQESVYELKRGNNEFDCIFFLEVLEHLEYPEAALKELFRVSNKYVLISIPCEPIWRILNMFRFKYLKNFGNTPGHLNHYSPNKITTLIKKFGKVKNYYFSFPWQIILAEKND